jgi:hypothetical protein
MALKKTVARSVVTVAATGCAALSLAHPAWALDRSIGVAECTQPPGDQKCAEVPSVTFDATTPAAIVDFTADPAHCSDIIVHVIVDGTEWGAFIVGPGERDGGLRIPLSGGRHTIAVQAEGMAGGCNTGRLASWGGKLHITGNR